MRFYRVNEKARQYENICLSTEKDGLVVTNTSCSSRRPELSSQYPHDGSQLVITQGL